MISFQTHPPCRCHYCISLRVVLQGLQQIRKALIAFQNLAKAFFRALLARVTRIPHDKWLDGTLWLGMLIAVAAATEGNFHFPTRDAAIAFVMDKLLHVLKR
jgi:hypothetical protein